MADTFVERVVLDKEGNVEVTLKYDDFLKELLQIAEGETDLQGKPSYTEESNNGALCNHNQ